MSNSYKFKSVAQVLIETASITDFLIDADKYYAHTSSTKKPELLSEHVTLVQDKFELLCTVHGLDEVIDRLIIDFARQNFEEDHLQEAGNFIKKLFVNSIVFHDYGKVNENFQAHVDKMNNPYFKGKEVENSPIATYHSALGAYLFIVKHLQEFYDIKTFTQQEHLPLSYCVLVLAYPIFKHHSPLLKDKIAKDVAFSDQEIKTMCHYIACYQFQLHDSFTQNIPANLDKIFQRIDDQTISFSLYALIKLNFSLLTAADYLATGEYMSNIKANDLGVLSRERIDQIYQNVIDREYLDTSKTKENYNRKTYLVLYPTKNQGLKREKETRVL